MYTHMHMFTIYSKYMHVLGQEEAPGGTEGGASQDLRWCYVRGGGLGSKHRPARLVQPALQQPPQAPGEGHRATPRLGHAASATQPDGGQSWRELARSQTGLGSNI